MKKKITESFYHKACRGNKPDKYKIQNFQEVTTHIHYKNINSLKTLIKMMEKFLFGETSNRFPCARSRLRIHFFLRTTSFPAKNHLFKVSNENTRKSCEKYSKSTMSLLLTSNMFDTFYIDEFEQIIACWVIISLSSKIENNLKDSTEAAADVLLKKMFLEISQNSQENTCARDSFLIKLQVLQVLGSDLQMTASDSMFFATSNVEKLKFTEYKKYFLLFRM